MPNKIHPTAIVDPSAVLGNNNDIGPYTIVGPGVEMGDDNWFGPHVVLNGPTKIGNGNKFFQFSSIGEGPQDLSYKNEPTRLEIGDNNVFRENVTVHRGTSKDKGLTKIGNHNLFMVGTHVAHDCIVHNHALFLNSSALAGHVEVQDHAIMGAFCAAHQFSRIGAYAFVTRAALVPRDVPPYLIVVGPGSARAAGLNKVGLLRKGFSRPVIEELWEAYKILYKGETSLEDALALLHDKENSSPELEAFIEFIEQAQKGRGILRVSGDEDESA